MLNQGYGLPAAIGWPAQNAGHPVAALRGFRSVFCLLIGSLEKRLGLVTNLHGRGHGSPLIPLLPRPPQGGLGYSAFGVARLSVCLFDQPVRLTDARPGSPKDDQDRAAADWFVGRRKTNRPSTIKPAKQNRN